MSNNSSVMFDYYDSVASGSYAIDEFTSALLIEVNCYVLAPLCFFGVLSNLGALFLFNRRPNITSGVSVFLKTLFILDIFQLTGTALLTTSSFCELALGDNSHSSHKLCIFYYRYVALILSRLVAIVDTGQVWALTALGVHRFWKISQPMRALSLDTPRRAKICVVGLMMFDFAFRIPMIFELKLSKHPTLNITVVTENLKLARNPTYNFVYYLILNTIFFNVIPFVLMFLTSFLTLKRLATARYSLINGERATLVRRIVARRKMAQLKASFSICAMTTVFMIFHSLFAYEVVQRWRFYVSGVNSPSFYAVSDVNTLLSMLSSTLNAFVYISLRNKSKTFLENVSNRQQMMAICRPRTRTMSSNLDIEALTFIKNPNTENFELKKNKINSSEIEYPPVFV